MYPAFLLFVSKLLSTGFQAQTPGLDIPGIYHPGLLWYGDIAKAAAQKTTDLRLSAYDILNADKCFLETTSENSIGSSNNLARERLRYPTFTYYFLSL